MEPLAEVQASKYMSLWGHFTSKPWPEFATEMSLERLGDGEGYIVS